MEYIQSPQFDESSTKSVGFFLYDILLKNVTDDDLTQEQKKTLVQTIPTLQHRDHETIYAIVTNFNYLSNSSSQSSKTIPYGGKKVVDPSKKMEIRSNEIEFDFKFDLDSFPKKLKQMLYRFVTLHVNNDEERPM